MHARSPTEGGFSIVETMIFLAISGLMFALVIGAISTKQQQTEFTTGVDSLKSELNEDLSDVEDGNYPEFNNDNCIATTIPSLEYTISSSAPDGSCTVIGEIISFNGDVSSNPTQSYNVFPLLGLNYVGGSTSGQIATNLAAARPEISASYYKNENLPFQETIDNSTGTTITSVSGGVGAFGLINFTSYDGTSGSALASGSGHVEIFALPTSSLNDTISDTVNELSGGTGIVNCNDPVQNNSVCIASTGEQLNPPVGITFCVDSGTDKESALFTIGGTNNPSAATDQIYDSTGCVD